MVNDTDSANNADDNATYFTGRDINEVIQSLKEDSLKLFQWFQRNQMKSSKIKCNFLKNNKNYFYLRTHNKQIDNIECEKLLGPRKSMLFLEIGRVKDFLSLTCPYSRMCIRIYISKKPKESKEEKRISPKNRLII